MEINKLSAAVGIYKNNGSGCKFSAKNKTAPAAKKVDTFEMSPAARKNLERAEASKAAGDAAPAERLAALKAQIADGSYNVSPESVAAAILA